MQEVQVMDDEADNCYCYLMTLMGTSTRLHSAKSQKTVIFPKCQ